jgi:tetratricopeptide (TPR) repeat protein
LNDDPAVLGVLGRAYGVSGNRKEAEKMLDQLKELSKQRYVAAYSFALVYLGLGDKNEALHWLEQSYQDRAGSDIGYIRVDPLLDPLRGDPRFEALAEKIIPGAEFKEAIASFSCVRSSKLDHSTDCLADRHWFSDCACSGVGV